MKKLLLLLFSLLLSFNSYGGSQLDFTLSDFCYQQPNVQDRGGVFYYPNEEVGITDSSLCVYKDLYGQYMSKVELVKGKFEGKFISWWENGATKHEKNYKDGKLVGKWIEMWSDGRVNVERNYVNGKKVSQTNFFYYDDGQIKQKYSYKDTRSDFENTFYYENGQIKRQYNISGNGKAISWYENGQIKTEAIIKNGMLEGKETSWYENGQMMGEANFKDGKREGDFNWWRSDGLKWVESVYSNDKMVSCDNLNESLPWDLFVDLSSPECPEPEPTPKGITIGDEIVSQASWVNTVAEKVKSNWRYQGAEDDWQAEVYVVQDRDGTIVAVDVRNSNVGDSQKAKVFKDSIRRAVYKSSPLPKMDDAYYSNEFIFIFGVN